MAKSEDEFSARIEGRICMRLQVQQNLHEGRLADEWNVLFLELDSGTSLRFFFDAGVFSWREEVPSTAPSNRPHECRLVEPRALSVPRGRQIHATRFLSRPAGAQELRITFDGNATLLVRNENDQTVVALEQGRAS